MSGLTVGAPACLAVIDLERTWTIDREKVESKSSNTPFHGFEVEGLVESVLYRGQWVMRDGVIRK